MVFLVILIGLTLTLFHDLNFRLSCLLVLSSLLTKYGMVKISTKVIIPNLIIKLLLNRTLMMKA